MFTLLYNVFDCMHIYLEENMPSKASPVISLISLHQSRSHIISLLKKIVTILLGASKAIKFLQHRCSFNNNNNNVRLSWSLLTVGSLHESRLTPLLHLFWHLPDKEVMQLDKALCSTSLNRTTEIFSPYLHSNTCCKGGWGGLRVTFHLLLPLYIP